MSNRRRFIKNRRHRTGLASILVTIAVSLSVLLLMAAADRAEARYGLKKDVSFNQVATISLQTDEVLSALQHPVHLYALFSPGQEDTSLISLLERYAAASPMVSFSQENLLQNPLLVSKVSSQFDDHAVTTDSLIVECADTGRIRVLDGTNYLQQSYDPASGVYYVSGLTYEKSLTEAILYVTADRLPVVQVLAGHDELDAQETAALRKLLTDANYECRTVSLASRDTLDANHALMILSPRKDLPDSELRQIAAFTAQGGSLFITTDFDDPDALPNFDALLASVGFARKAGLVVADQDAPGTYFESPAYLMPTMQETGVTTELIATGKDTVVLPGARALRPATDSAGTLTVETVLKSGPAYIRQLADGQTSLDKQPDDETGVFDLALLSSKMHQDGTRSKAFIIGNSSVFTDAWLHSNTYSVELLSHIIHYLDGKNLINLPIAPREAVRPPLVIGASILPSLILAALPLSTAIAAVIVLMRRKGRQH